MYAIGASSKRSRSRSSLWTRGLVFLTERTLDTQPLDLSAHVRGKDAHHRNAARTVGHRLVVDDRDMAEDPALRIEHRYAGVALRTPYGQQLIVGKSRT